MGVGKREAERLNKNAGTTRSNSTTQPTTAQEASKMATTTKNVYKTVDSDGKVIGTFKTKGKAVEEYDRDKAVFAVLSPSGRVVHGTEPEGGVKDDDKPTKKAKAEKPEKAPRVTGRGMHCPECGSVLVDVLPLPEEGGYGERACPEGHFAKRYPIVDMARFDLQMDYTRDYVPVFGGGATTARAVVEAYADGMSPEDIQDQFNKKVYLAKIKAEREEARAEAARVAREAKAAEREAKKAEREAEKQAERDAKALAKAEKAEAKAAEKAADES